jgi:hypothetical protein
MTPARLAELARNATDGLYGFGKRLEEFRELIDAVCRLQSRNLALYKSLRLVAVDECDGVGTCSRCDGHWTYGTAEQHNPGCLAAPEGTPE